MSKIGKDIADVDDRDAFRTGLGRLVRRAHSNTVHVEGSYEVRADDGTDYEVTVSGLAESSRLKRRLPPNESRPNAIGDVDVTSRSSLVQTLSGRPLPGDGTDTECTGCGRRLQEGDRITAGANSRIEDFRWTVENVFCGACSVGELRAPRFGRTDVLVETAVCSLSDTRHQTFDHVTGTVDIVDYSPVSEGEL